MPAPALSPARWIHHDERLTANLAAAEDRARRNDWTSGPLSVRADQLRALLVDTAYQMGKLEGSTARIMTAQGQEALYISPAPTSPEVPRERRGAAARLYRTWDLLAKGAQASEVETFAGAPVETAGLPQIVMVAVVVTAGAALAYCGHEAAKVVDRELARQATAQQLAAAHVSALEVIDRHTEREDRAGQQLPLDAASRAALDNLGQAQSNLAGRTEPDFGGDILPRALPWQHWATGALVGLAAAVALFAFTTRPQGVI